MSEDRLLAERCVKLASKEKHQGSRRALLDLAGQWFELADYDPKAAALMAEVEGLKRSVN
jgi:hypothetical protein